MRESPTTKLTRCLRHPSFVFTVATGWTNKRIALRGCACTDYGVYRQGCVVRGGSESKGSCITPNALRWIGTESGVAPDPTWSTGFTKGGDPTSDMWCPSESDTTLQLSGEPDAFLLTWRLTGLRATRA